MGNIDTRLTTDTSHGAVDGLQHNHGRHTHRLRSGGVYSETARHGSREDVLLGRLYDLVRSYNSISISP